MELNFSGSNVSLRVDCGKMTIERPEASRALPSSSTARRSSRGFSRPIGIAPSDVMMLRKNGTFISDCLMTKVKSTKPRMTE